MGNTESDTKNGEEGTQGSESIGMLTEEEFYQLTLEQQQQYMAEYHRRRQKEENDQRRKERRQKPIEAINSIRGKIPFTRNTPDDAREYSNNGAHPQMLPLMVMATIWFKRHETNLTKLIITNLTLSSTIAANIHYIMILTNKELNYLIHLEIMLLNLLDNTITHHNNHTHTLNNSINTQMERLMLLLIHPAMYIHLIKINDPVANKLLVIIPIKLLTS